MILFYLILALLPPAGPQEPPKVEEWTPRARIYYRVFFEIEKTEVCVTMIHRYCSMYSIRDKTDKHYETCQYIYNVERRAERSDGMVFWIHIGTVSEEHFFWSELTRIEFNWLTKNGKGVAPSMEEALEQMLKD